MWRIFSKSSTKARPTSTSESADLSRTAKSAATSRSPTARRSFTPPPAPPAWTDDSRQRERGGAFSDAGDLWRQPERHRHGAIARLRRLDQQSVRACRPRTICRVVLANASADPTDPYPSTAVFNTWWQQSVTAPDQLRQRVAFALSEIMVVSENGVLQNNADRAGLLLRHAARQCLRQFPRAAQGGHAHAGDGPVSQHAGQRQGQHHHRHPRQRKLRARNQPAVFHRPEPRCGRTARWS